MAKGGSVKMDLRRLKEFAESLRKLKEPRVQVGIFGMKAHRRTGGVTNAEVGFAHEFGAPGKGIPQRSFLRMPLMLKGKKIYGDATQEGGKLETFRQSKQFLELVGGAAVKYILEAFGTAGWGAWPPLKYSTILSKLKGGLNSRQVRAHIQTKSGEMSSSPLVDTGQLKGSIAWRVVG